MYAKVFGLLPKAVGSLWIFLKRRMICFRKVILVTLEKSTGVLGQSDSSFQRAWAATAFGPCGIWQSAGKNEEKWAALRGLVRRVEVGANLILPLCFGGPNWLYCLLLRGSAGEGWGSLGTFEKEIAFGYHAALLHVQISSAESDWERIAGQEQRFISGARFKLTEGTWIIGLYGSHWLQSRNSPFSNAGH